MSRFQDMLIFLRKREGLSQLELAEKLGISKSTISMYEQGQRKPSFEMLEAIADYFNINMGTLTGQDENSQKPLTPLQQQAIDLVMGLSDEDLQKFVMMGRILKGEK